MKNKVKKWLEGFGLLLLLCVLCGQTIPVFAKEGRTYTVTIRSGNAGSFTEQEELNDMENVECTANYIKITVEKGKTVKEATGDFWQNDTELNEWCKQNIVTNDSKDLKYAVKDFDEKKEITTTPVKRNTEYIVDYARVIEENNPKLTVTKEDEKWWEIFLHYFPFSTR